MSNHVVFIEQVVCGLARRTFMLTCSATAIRAKAGVSSPGGRY